jgi:NAD(P)-dependent dehydrogenase (short-subunit alcohol dehydrogenase family)
MPHSDSKVWFITGSSKGFGRIWTEAALARGDRVAATARDLDVVVNNAGYGLFGMIEEVTESEARAQIETNLFGALWITQAALPIMRAQGTGHIIQVSSIGGVETFRNVGLYNASKWGLEGFTQALAQEVGELGIKVTMIEPIGYTTDWGGPSAQHSKPLAAYDQVRAASVETHHSRESGDPEATAEAILDIVDSDDPPLRCFFGNWALGHIKDTYATRIATWEEWDWVSQKAHGS